MSDGKVKYKVPEFEDIVKSTFAQNKEIGANYVEGFERVFPVGWGKDAEGQHAYFHMAITDMSFSPTADYDSYEIHNKSGGGEIFYVSITYYWF